MSMPRDSNGRFVSPSDHSGRLRKAHAWVHLGSENDERDVFDPVHSFEAIDGDRHLVGVFIQIYGDDTLVPNAFGNIEISKSAQPALLGDVVPDVEGGESKVVSADETRSSVIAYAGYRDISDGSDGERQRVTDTKTMYFDADRTWN